MDDEEDETPDNPAEMPEQIVIAAPMVEPWDVGVMPDFGGGDAASNVPGDAPAPPAQPASAAPIVRPVLGQADIAEALRAIFDATAEMAGTGDAGKLSDVEARLIARLTVDFVNEWLAKLGANDAGRAKLLIAVGILTLSKGRVYVVAIRAKQRKAADPPPPPLASVPDAPVRMPEGRVQLVPTGEFSRDEV